MFSGLIELAADLEVPAVVTVTGRVHPLLRPAAERLQDWVRDGIERLLPVAERAGVRLLLENIPMAPLPAAAGLAAFCRNWQNPALGICYDVANAHFIGEDPALGLREVAPYLGLVHASDTGRDVWRHDRIGSGTVDFAPVPDGAGRRRLRRTGRARADPGPAGDGVSGEPGCARGRRLAGLSGRRRPCTAARSAST